jgi:hypothetical protein
VMQFTTPAPPADDICLVSVHAADPLIPHPSSKLPPSSTSPPRPDPAHFFVQSSPPSGVIQSEAQPVGDDSRFHPS